jgi:hypothetical protein
MYQLTSLEIRRKVVAVTFLYKLINGFINSPSLLALIKINTPRINARELRIFYCANYRTNLGLNSPVNIMCTAYNSIHSDIDIFNCTLKQLIQISLKTFNVTT